MLQEERAYPEVAHRMAAVGASLGSIIDVTVEDLVEDCVMTPKKGESVTNAALEPQEVVASGR